MTVLTWNVRGWGSDGRRTELLDLLKEKHISICGIMESQINRKNHKLVRQSIPKRWKWEGDGGSNARFRIILFWNPSIWDLDIINTSDQFIHAHCTNRRNRQHFDLSVVYGHNVESRRKDLWAHLVSAGLRASTSNDAWLVSGDFNSVRLTNEKVGGRKLNSKVLERFNEAITEAGLMDLNLKGWKLSWSNRQGGEGRILGRIDRTLVNVQWVSAFASSWVEALPTGTSDHSPLHVSWDNSLNWGKKPFKYCKLWSRQEGYKEVVEEAWNSQVLGNPQFKTMGKLKAVKLALKDWKSALSVETTVKIRQETLASIQSKIQEDPLNPSLAQLETEAVWDLQEAFKCEEDFFRLKARSQWLRLGERCTKLFHSIHKSRCNSNFIGAITLPSGELTSDPESIKNHAVQFFSDLYNGNSPPPSYAPVATKRLSQEDVQILNNPFKIEELDEVIKFSEPDKAPGPDGFTMAFYKTHWPLIRRDVWAAVHNFFDQGKLLKSLNNSFVTLVPKTPTANSLSDYRPISLCNCVYKLISKLMANRIKLVLGNVISNNQAAFIPGRNIQDNTLLAHELIRGFDIKRSPKRACIKLDLYKAFDSIDRSYILHILNCMGFPSKWISWIRECITTPMISVLVNGSPNGFFKTSRGIRQGDPLSPYLFSVAMEGLTVALNEGLLARRWDSYNLHSSATVSHLFFADDILIFIKANDKSIRGLKCILSKFGKQSGLNVSTSKSQLFLAKSVHNREELATLSGISVGFLPIRYLGIPLSTNAKRLTHYTPLLEKIRGKIASWNNVSLSYGSRLELCKTILQSYLYYWSASLPIPKTIILAIDRMFKNFIWGNSKTRVKWDMVCLPKKEGGLGLRRVTDICQASYLKMAWRLHSDGGNPWSAWMKARYFPNCSLCEATEQRRSSAIWRNIWKAKDLLRDNIPTLVRNDKFLFSKAWNLIREKRPRQVECEDVWKNKAPVSYSFLWWRTLWEKLPTRDKVKPPLPEQDKICPLCRLYTENSKHIFFDCGYSYNVLRRCMSSIDITIPLGSTLRDVASITRAVSNNRQNHLFANTALSTILTVIWEERNCRVFELKSKTMGVTIQRIGRRVLDIWQANYGKVNDQPTSYTKWYRRFRWGDGRRNIRNYDSD